MTNDVFIHDGRIVHSPGVDVRPEQLHDVAELAQAVALVHGSRAALRLVMQGGDLGVQLLPSGRDEMQDVPLTERPDPEMWWPDGRGVWRDSDGRWMRWRLVRRQSGEPAAIEWSVIR